MKKQLNSASWKILFAGLIGLSALAHGATLVSVSGADFGSTGIVGLGTGWSQSSAYANVRISAHLVNGGGPGYVSQGTVYLMRSIGPGTTAGQEVSHADFTLPAQYDGMFTLFSGLSLSAGNYWIVFSVPQSPFSYASWVSSNPATVTSAGGASFAGDVLALSGVAAYPPASVFTYFPSGYASQNQFAVTGDPVSPLVSVGGADAGGTGIAGMAAGWSLSQAYANVGISAHLVNGGGPGYVSQGTVYLMRSIGPGSTTGQEVTHADFTLPAQYDGMFTLFSGLLLPAGNYMIVFSTPQSPSSYASWVLSNPATVSSTGGAANLGWAVALSGVAAYPPASVFTYFQSGYPIQYQFAVTGDPFSPVVSVGGTDSGGSGVAGLGAGWSLSQAYANVSVLAHLVNGGGPGYVSQGTVYLMRSIGPGTTTDQEITHANFTLPAQYDGMLTLFSGLSLPAGNYWIVFSTPQSPFSYANWVASNPATVSSSDGATYLGDAIAMAGLAAYPPASIFTNLGVGYPNKYQFAVAGIPLKVDAAIQLSASPNPAVAAQPVTLTASLSPADASGTVQFFDAGTLGATATVANGTASVTPTALAVGSHSLTAVYSGDSKYNGSTSPVLTLTVAKVPTTSVATLTSGTVVYAHSQPVTATVTPAAATGTVQFMDGAMLLATMPLAGGTTAIDPATLEVGTHSITVVYSGDATYAGSTSAVAALTVIKATATATLASSLNPSVAGQTVTFTAVVSPPIVTGTVQFLDGTTAIGTAPVSDTLATLSTATLTAGTHSITAVYSGNNNYNGATSDALTQTVTKVPTTSVATLTSGTVTYAHSQPVTATVTPAAATGTVQFMDGAMLLATMPLAGGTTAIDPATLEVGTHPITVVYSGDATYAGSTSAVAVLTVIKATATATLASSLNPSVVGQTVTFTAMVSPPIATGTVQFLDGTAVIGTAPVSGTVASLSTATLTAGPHSITAVYSGNNNYNGATSAVLTQTVTKVQTSVAALTSGTVTYAHDLPITATVTPAAATGTVQFMDGAMVLVTMPLAGGTAAISPANMPVGTHSITVVYSGDATYAGSTSAVALLTVIKATSTATLASSLNPSVVGQTVTFTAMVSPPIATGTVQFLDGATVIGTAALSGTLASVSTTALAAGTHSITAVYSGDNNYNRATSAALTQTVKAATTTTVSANKSTAVAGQTVTFSATVSPAAAPGSVTFLDGAQAIGSVAVSGGAASLAVSNLAVGIHSVTASYGGAAGYAASASTAVSVTITAVPPAGPSHLVATASSSSQINLTWTASATAGVTYNVYASATAGFTPSPASRIATGVTATNYAQQGLGPMTTKYYLVTAQNANGESAASNQASATTQSVCKVTYSVTSQWNVGFGTAITIKNTGTAPIQGWQLTWTWAGNQKITQSWNSKYSQAGTSATMTNETWNGTIAAGATLTGEGFNASYSGTNQNPTVFYLNGALCQ